MVNAPSFVVLDELRDFIIPLNRDELLKLETSLHLEGCQDPLIVWKKSDNELVLVDGHHRYLICRARKIPFTFRVIAFDDIENVKIWVIENQISRRNLTQDQLSYYRGLKYLSLKKRRGGVENIRAKGKAEDSTSEVLSKEFNVSASTIKRDRKFVEGLNLISKADSTLTMKILTGQLRIKKTRIQALSRIKDPNAIIDKWLKGDFIGAADGHSSDSSPQNIGSIKKIRGMMLSTINRVIGNRDRQEITELRLLVSKLESELFGEEQSIGYHDRSLI